MKSYDESYEAEGSISENSGDDVSADKDTGTVEIIDQIVDVIRDSSDGVDAIEMILNNIQHINTPHSFTGETLLHYAAGYGHANVVKLLLDRSPESLYVQNPDDAYPIHCAVANDNAEIVEHMMSINPLVITLENGMQDTPLHTAVSFCHPHLLKTLLFYDENPEQTPIVGSDGNTYYDDNVMLVIYAAEFQNEFGQHYYDIDPNIQNIDLVSFFSV